jgi:hypothetical protein
VNASLDTFESALPTRLREHVDHQFALRHRRSQHRLLIAAAVTGVAAAVIVVVPALGSDAAYSVGEGDSGTITVEVHRLEDAEGLEGKLAKYGVKADVTYLPERQECAPGRYTPVARRLSGLKVSMGTQMLRVELPPGTVRYGETFVMDVSGEAVPPSSSEPSEDGVIDRGGFIGSGEMDVAAGPVQPCSAVPGTAVDDAVALPRPVES